MQHLQKTGGPPTTSSRRPSPHERDRSARRRALRRFLFWGVWLEEDLDRKLGDARISSFSGAERAKGVAGQLVEAADVIRSVHRAGAHAFGSEVGMVEKVEIFCAQLNAPAFRDEKVFGK